MQHAEHFLSRLVRLADDEIKLALALYHDSGWVREILQSGGLPDATPRVALSLSDPREGPFVVVTRDGHFVTCLARGMRPGQLPVVARERLIVSGAKVGRERERAQLQQRLEGGDTRLRTLLRRLFSEADRLSLEDFQEVAAWEPLLGPLFVNSYLAMGAELTEQNLVLRRRRLARRASDETLHGYWNLLHATGHLALLAAMTTDRDGYDSLTGDDLKTRAAFSYPLTGTGVTVFMLKGAWAAGRMGKPMLAAYKRALAEDGALFELFDTLLVLLVLGRRSAKLRAEITKAISAAPGRADCDAARTLRAAFQREIELVCELTVDLLAAPRGQLDAVLEHAAASYVDAGARPPEDKEVQAVLRTLPLLSWSDGITDGRRFSMTLTLAAAASELEAERFYLPSAALGEALPAWTPDLTWKVLEPITKAVGSGAPPRQADAKPGRNDPCPCESGKKYKRCCGAAV